MEASTAYGCFPQAERIVSVAEVPRPCFRSQSETPLAPHLLWRVALCPDCSAQQLVVQQHQVQGRLHG